MIRLFTFMALSVYWGGMFLGTHMPRGFKSLGHVDDKVLHFGAYAGLGFLLAAMLSSFRLRFRAIFVTLLVAAVYGSLDELSQLPIPGRQADLADWFADVLGAGMGVAMFAIMLPIVNRIRSRFQTAPEPTRYERC